MSRDAETAFLVKFLEENRDLVSGKFAAKFPDRAAHNQAWEDIALQVNSLGLSRYKRKGPEMRKKWTDLKNRIKKKHAMIHNQIIGTEGDEEPKDALTPMEEKVIRMLGTTSSSKGINTEGPMDIDSTHANSSRLSLTLDLDEDIDRPIKLEPTEELVLGTYEVSSPPTSLISHVNTMQVSSSQTPLISHVNTVQAPTMSTHSQVLSPPKILPIMEEAAVNPQELVNGGLSSLATIDKTPRVMAFKGKKRPKRKMDHLFELEEKRLKLEEEKLKIKKESLENKKRQTKIMEEQLGVLKKLLEKFD